MYLTDQRIEIGLGFFPKERSRCMIHSKGKGKVAPLIMLAPRHEDLLGAWRYSSTHS
jgi:hypothetical protein